MMTQSIVIAKEKYSKYLGDTLHRSQMHLFDISFYFYVLCRNFE